MDIKVWSENAKNGTPILIVNKNGKEFRLNSIYQPEKEAERFAIQYKELEKGSIVIVFGYANGIFPAALNVACKDSANIIYYEPSAEIKRESNLQKEEELFEQVATIQYVLPLNDISHKNVFSLEQFPELLDRLINVTNYKKVQIIILPKYRELFPDEYEAFYKTVQYHVQKIQMNIATAKGMGYSAVVNNIRNLSHLENSYCSDSFVGMFPKNMPAIIVSAGPSLEKNVTVLRRAKNHALIICVDSAAKYLMKHEIQPDILVSVDPKKPLNLFEDDRLDGIPIIASTDSNYKIFEKIPRSGIIFASTENEYVQDLYRQTGHDIHRLKSGGSVATFAFSLCIQWGFQTIILIGQDLALADMQRYAGRERQELEGIELIEVPDIYGNPTYTVRDYYYYLKWFEEELALYPDVRVIDATEGGAKISGTEIRTLQNAVDECCTKSVQYEFSIKNFQPAFSIEQKKKVHNQIVESGITLKAFYNELEIAMKQAAYLCDLEKKGMHTSVPGRKMHEELLAVCNRYNRMKESFFIQRLIDAEYLEEFMGLFQENSNLTLGQYGKLQRYFEILRVATDKIIQEWDASVDDWSKE